MKAGILSIVRFGGLILTYLSRLSTRNENVDKVFKWQTMKYIWHGAFYIDMTNC